MSRQTHHVVPDSRQGGWNVIKGGASRASIHRETKVESEKAGRQISINQKTEFVIHGKDGKIQRSDSHGNDPCPPQDKQ